MAYRDNVLALSPVAYWELQETSGTQADDSSGNGHHGTYVNSPTLGDSSTPASIGGTSVVFDGTSQHVSLPTTSLNTAFSAATEATLVIWVKLDSNAPSSFQTGFAKFDSGSSATHYPWTDSNIYTHLFKGARHTTPSNSGFDKSEWHMVTIRSEPGAGGYDIWQNDSIFDSTSGDSSIPTFTDARIGASNDTYRLDGRLAHAALFDTALTDTQITDLYNSAFDTPGDPTLLSAKHSLTTFSEVILTFSEGMENLSDTAEYTFSPSLTVNTATPASSNSQVILDVSTLTSSTSYTVTVGSGIQDFGGNALLNNEESFKTLGEGDLADDPEFLSADREGEVKQGDFFVSQESATTTVSNPAVVSIDSVTSIDENTIRVTFTDPLVDDDALKQPSNFVVTGDTTVDVLAATPEDVANPTFVDLTTTEHKQGGNYTVTVLVMRVAP